MLFLYFLPFLWFISYISAKRAMEFQKDVEVWLEESMLFPECFGVEQVTHDVGNDYLSNSEIVKAESGEYKSEDDIQKLSNIMDGWMDEKLDLSILDYLEKLSDPQNDPQKVMVEDCSKLLDSLMDGNFNTLQFPFLENLPDENKHLESSDYIGSPATGSVPSPVGIVPEIILEVNSVASPSGYSVDCNISSPSESDSSFEESVKDCNLNFEINMKYAEELVLPVPLIVSPQSNSVLSEHENQKFLAIDHNMSSRHVSLKRNRAPYSEVYETKKQQRRERKKVQNKEAAARYRVKRRVQDKVLDDEVRSLESNKKKLEEKANQLKNEISYLKSLMREMYKVKGLLK